MLNNTTILPDMFYVKIKHKEAFLKTVVANEDVSATMKWHKYPEFLCNTVVCDYSGEPFNENDLVYCVMILKYI